LLPLNFIVKGIWQWKISLSYNLKECLKLCMKTIYNFFAYLAWFSKYFDQKQYAFHHLGIIIDLINWVFDDVKSRINLLTLLHVGLNFFEKFLKMLWVNWVY
jgi:hypothetical protein